MSATRVLTADAQPAWPVRLVGGLVLVSCLVWSYWPTLTELAAFWQDNEDYSVGQLVPLVALLLLWRDRTWLKTVTLRGSLWGAAALLAVQVLRFAALYYGYASGERLSLVLSISALILLVGGWTLWRHWLPLQAFLLLMLPPPMRVHNAVSLPLQDLATSLGVFGLELLGYFVKREGNVLLVDGQTSVMVAEACSGLRMLTAFIFSAGLLALLIRRPAWKKWALLLASLPIAIFANGLRVLATSIFVNRVQSSAAEQQFHDLAGLLMMPVAIVLLLVLLKFLDVVAPEPRAVDAIRNRPADAKRARSSAAAGRDRRTAAAPPAGAGVLGGRGRNVPVFAAFGVVLLLAGGFGHRALEARIAAALGRMVQPAQPLESLPLELGAWRGEEVPLNVDAMNVAWFDDLYVNRAYQNAEAQRAISVFIGYVGRPRANLGHRPDVCFMAHGWKQTNAEPMQLATADGRPVPAVLYEFGREGLTSERMRVLGTFMINGQYVDDPDRFRQWNSRTPGLLGERPAYLTRVQVGLRASADREADLALLSDFAARVTEEVAARMPYWEEAR